MCHVAAALRRAGHRVELFDSNLDGETVYGKLRAAAPDVIGLSMRNVDDVDIGSKTFYVPEVVETIRKIRESTNAPLVLGGSAYSLFPERILECSGADYGVRGEGEAAMVALVDALERATDYRRIPGLVYREKGAIVANDNSVCAAGEIARPCRPAELVRSYLHTSAMLNVQTQRGCGFTCCYCTYPVLEGRRLRFREPGEVVGEIEEAMSLGAHYLFFVDSVLNTSADHVHRICEEIVRRELDVNWGCFLRPRGLTDDTFRLMKRAGLRHVEFGTDSFCDSVLECYGKAFTFEDVFHSSELARTHGVRHAHFLILGGPGEDRHTLQEGFDNSRRLRRTVIFPYIGMRLYPGTPLYRTALNEGVIESGFDLLEPRFYLSPALDAQTVRATLERFAHQSGMWIAEGPSPEQIRIARNLRAKGVEGPLWEFLIQ
jgi:radical SAM superfamily enzyme YgiQ (UPF0313 family)